MLKLLYRLLLIAIMLGCVIGVRVLSDATQDTPTTPIESSQVIYLAHCDGTHYKLVATDSDIVAESEMRLEYWPIPEDYYAQLSDSLDTLTCVPGPMDKVTNN